MVPRKMAFRVPPRAKKHTVGVLSCVRHRESTGAGVLELAKVNRSRVGPETRKPTTHKFSSANLSP
jgi:hypothetical protein